MHVLRCMKNEMIEAYEESKWNRMSIIYYDELFSDLNSWGFPTFAYVFWAASHHRTCTSIMS